ncbi:Tim44 domain-containing protein [Thaumasiovibrio subtropicus]|uniref:Tim44 domain-containing protein n=1 Tax=Thaumasiovibrio subtropicus TaxID=1891207 RepID=UPI000B35FB14|nr:TIM44-like domain-containing protein [Thaumasiovibrio subtropicus]
MKKLFSLLTVVMMVFVIAVPEAEAKRMGGGRSLGKTHRTAPSQQQATPQNRDTIAQQPKSNRSGLMGGLLGGLLAGGLIAALFGGAFDGIQMMDILIVALLVWLGMRLLRMRRPQSATAGYQHAREAQSQSQPWQQGGNTAQGGFAGASSDVPFNLPKDFQMSAFLNGAREHYRTLQGAWNHNDFDTMSEYLSPALLAELKAERASLTEAPQTEVMYVDAEIVRAECDHSLAQISVKYTGKVCDRAEGSEESVNDVWHLERDLLAPNAPWMIVGIEGS